VSKECTTETVVPPTPLRVYDTEVKFVFKLCQGTFFDNYALTGVI